MAESKKTIKEPEIITSVDEITVDNILCDAVFDYIFSVKDLEIRDDEIRRCTEIAKKARKKGEFVKTLDAWSRAEARARKTGKIINMTHFFDKDHADEELACGAWTADQKGIRKLEISRDTQIEYIACPVPLYPSRVFVNRQDKTAKIELKFKDGGVWKTITPSRSTISTAQKITKLSDMNLPITSEIAKNTVNYLFDVLRLNPDKIKTRESTSKLGWMKTKKGYDFMPYNHDHLTFDADDRFKNIYDSIGEHGDYFSWLAMARKIRASGRIEPRIMMAASVASVLVEPLNLNPFIVHLFGQTEGGKTVCLMLATSIWANPNPESGYCGNFKTTQVALETRADMLNNLPLILDDTAQVSQRIKDDFSQTIYTLCSGTGKDRSNAELGIRRANTWRNCVLTTGEHPIINEDAQGGAINRVILIPAGHSRIFADGHAVAETCKKNYGFAGPLIVREIKRLGFDALNEMYNQFFEELKKGKMEKQAQSVAALLVADHILVDVIFGDGDYLTAAQLVPYIRGENEISEPMRCYRFFVDQVEINDANFYNDDDPDRKVLKNWGRKDSASGIVYIYKSEFEKLIRQESNFSAKAFIEWAARNSVLIHQADRYTYKARMFPNAGNYDTKRKTCYAIDYGSKTAQALLERSEKIENIEMPDVIRF